MEKLNYVLPVVDIAVCDVFCGFSNFFHAGAGGRSLLRSDAFGSIGAILYGRYYQSGTYHGSVTIFHVSLCQSPTGGLETGIAD
jgi:hypothetical protein